MEPSDLELISSYEITDLDSVAAAEPDSAGPILHFGPQILVFASLQARSPLVKPYAKMIFVIALSGTRFTPVALSFVMADDAEASNPIRLSWQRDTRWPDFESGKGPVEVPGEVEELASRVICRFAMDNISGYHEYAKAAHRAFIAFADV